MRSRVKLILFLVVLSAVSLSASESRVVFTETFDGTGVKPLGFTDACWVRESPPSRKRLAFIPKDNQVSDVHEGLFTLPKGTAECRDYELSFKFKFPRQSQKAFTLTIVSGSPEDTKGHVSERIIVSQEIISFEPIASSADTQNLTIKLMPDDFWHEAFVRVKGKTIELFVENDGVIRKFAETKSSGKPLLGFNFSGSTTVDFDDIEICRIDATGGGKFNGVDGINVIKPSENTTKILQGADVVSSDGDMIKMDIPAEATMAAASFRIGTYPGEMAIKLAYADGSEKTVEVKTFPAEFMKNVIREDTIVKETVILPDAGVAFKENEAEESPLNLIYYTRPGRKHKYKQEGELRIISTWESFPAGSQKFIRFELRPDKSGAQIWIDGRYAGHSESASKIIALAFVLPANGAVMDKEVSTKPLSARYLPLDVRQIANPGAMADAKPSLIGAQEILGIPFLVVDGPGNADTGVCRENLGTFKLEYDGYLSRTPFDGMPESLMLSVPPAQYNRAWALCAVEENPDKVTVITARLTKFLPRVAGRGPAITDTAITLPRLGEPLPEGVKKVGDVKTGGKTLPLYLVEFKMDIGSIQEIIFQEKQPWLDFEILGKRYDKDNYYFDHSRKPSEDISGVHVFGATLEQSPAAMWIMPTVFGNIYQPGENPVMTATLYANEKTSCKLSWTVHDIKGQEREKGSKKITFAKAGDETKVETPFTAKDLGWYSVNYTLADKHGNELLKHTAYFSLIAADTRKAGYESPYYTWNFGGDPFNGAHGTVSDINLWGPLLLKAGIRNTHVESEKIGEPWKLTKGQFPRIRLKGQDPEEEDKELEEAITNLVTTYPNTSMALIFHESGGGPFPLEILGGTTKIDEAVTNRDKNRAESFKSVAKAYRKHAPHIKLVVGNSGTSTPGLMAQLFRAKVPRETIDYIGEETAGMSLPPEISVSQENWILKETARVFGYEGVPICACYEWKCRRSRHLGLQRLAEWHARDILIAHAWKFPLIPTAGLPDVSSSYYNSVWGDGAFTPTPQVYPKPGYAAVSTATLVLDCAKFVRMIPTGSLTVYALEFKRENEFVYAFWSARGELDTALEFEKDATIKHTAFLGHESQLKSTRGKTTIRVGEGAVYLTSPVALKAVTALGERSFPGEQPPVDAKIAVASRMNTLKGWELDTAATAWTNALPMMDVVGRTFRQPGTYELRSVKDEQKGDCLELELIKEGDRAALIQEYVFLKLNDAVALPGTPNTVGLWVKGNSSWGKIFWEIEDAEGEKWLSVGTGGYGCNAYDWPELVGINFDGWHFLRFPITAKSDVTVQSPGQDAYQWQHDGAGNRKIDYPIKITGIAVSMARQTLNLLEMEPVETIVRLKDLSAY